MRRTIGMPDYKTILAATDFSRSAAIAVSRAAHLARAANARLELVHVMPPEPDSTSWPAFRGLLGFDWKRTSVDAMDQLRLAAERIDAEFELQVESRLIEGKPHQKIAARAIEIDADLVVVGAHGEHFVLDVFTGTTAHRVQRFSTVPVLVVRQASLHRYEQVLVATDFSVASAAAAKAALRFFPGAMFHVLHAFEVPFTGRLASVGVNQTIIDDYRRQVGDQALRELEAFVRETGLEGSAASVRVQHGYAPARIRERAAELDVDVVALGTQGKSWLEIGFLGSVTEHVATESPADVLLVRPPA
ncbi:MAG: universal stress protein [Burkholderiales bacterium]|nr:universal stress protein [Burkholderiales bacterium]